MLDQLPSEILVHIYYKSITLNDVLPKIIEINEYMRFCLRYDVKKTWWKQQIIKMNLVKWIRRWRMKKQRIKRRNEYNEYYRNSRYIGGFLYFLPDPQYTTIEITQFLISTPVNITQYLTSTPIQTHITEKVKKRQIKNRNKINKINKNFKKSKNQMKKCKFNKNYR